MVNDQWRKSTYSQGGATNCVEFRTTDAEVQVRDTQNRAAGHLSFPPVEWSAFLADLQTDDL
ncbi:DUF397 domain-containing protein [Allosalinactinospora lopnorensis]|uniref:DUF397 domain-containing protein n=1 Tax=Allosalinactinospora lopnorensis TaxID=1352348 RepID=UPI000623EBF0|nr:DUF397 domain-containing protein [Allosalinactinospora lopnorensis]